jgi:hypothetical protein
MYNLWWMKQDNNFGDLLSPYIFDYYNLNYKFTEKDSANTLCIGSIARLANDNALILGSGTASKKYKLNPNSTYKFVRGPLTRKYVIRDGGVCPDIYGDPALLLPKFCKESKKEYKIGIVPHFVDYKFAKENFPKYNIIDVINQDPLVVAQEITKCEKIISSSLHGIIAAHAYGIPAAWIKLSKKVKGDDTKFYDYFMSVGCSLTDPNKSLDNIKYYDRNKDLTKDIEEQFLELA